MRAAGDDGGFGAAAGEAGGEIAADRAGAEDAELQERISSAAREIAWTPSAMQASSGL